MKPMLCRKIETILVIMGNMLFPYDILTVFLSGQIVDKKTNGTCCRLLYIYRKIRLEIMQMIMGYTE